MGVFVGYNWGVGSGFVSDRSQIIITIVINLMIIAVIIWPLSLILRQFKLLQLLQLFAKVMTSSSVKRDLQIVTVANYLRRDRLEGSIDPQGWECDPGLGPS